MESPIPILPLPTPDAETEKLIRMKDEEVGGEWGAGPGWVGGVGRSQAGLGGAGPAHRSLTPPPAAPAPPPAKADARDAAENEAADAGPVTPPQPHVP